MTLKTLRALKCDLTAGEVRALLDYKMDDGIFRWRHRPGGGPGINSWNTKYAHRIAGSYSHGHIAIGIHTRFYLAHRLAWLVVTGQWPVGELDHKDCDKANNRFDNLRIATHSQNSGNAGAQKNNSTGCRGVSFCASTGKYHASISMHNKKHFLGSFDTVDHAAEVYRRAAEAHFGEFARVAR